MARGGGSRSWAGYLILVSAMLLAWWAFPLLALSIFLFLSVLHFGDQDASAKAPFRCLRILVHGGVPIVVSAASHPDAIERLLAALVPGQANVVATVLGGPLLMLWAAAGAVTIVAYAARGHADDVAAAADLILVALLFAVAPPLIAFSLYFAAIHAPRAFAAAIPAGGMQAGEIVVARRPDDAGPGARRGHLRRGSRTDNRGECRSHGVPAPQCIDRAAHVAGVARAPRLGGRACAAVVASSRLSFQRFAGRTIVGRRYSAERTSRRVCSATVPNTRCDAAE